MQYASFSTLKILATVKPNGMDVDAHSSFSTLKILATVKHSYIFTEEEYVLVPLRF